MFKSINLGRLRTWIKWNCVRGDSIIFGSDTEVHFKGQFTYKEFEKLVSEVVNDNKKELTKEFLRYIEMQKNIDSQSEEGKLWNQMRVDKYIEELREFAEEKS